MHKGRFQPCRSLARSSTSSARETTCGDFRHFAVVELPAGTQWSDRFILLVVHIEYSEPFSFLTGQELSLITTFCSSLDDDVFGVTTKDNGDGEKGEFVRIL